jgi:TonB family protein
MRSLDHRLDGRAKMERRPASEFRAGVAAGVLCLHLAGLVALDLLDRMRPPVDAGAAVEIPVEMVTETPQKEPAEQPAPAQSDAAQPKSPAAEAAAKAPRGVVIERPRESELPQKARARGAADAEPKKDNEEEPKDSKAQDQPFGALAALDKTAEAPGGPVFLSPTALMQPRKPRADKESGNDNFRAKVLQKVQDAMIDPERPRPKAVALVSFAIDANGALVSAELARPSGHADLDAEALDMVRRAAPFPAPPANADRRFGAFIEFGG